MRRSGIVVAGIMLLGLAAMGCQNKVHDENIALHREARELRARNLELETQLRQSPDPAALQTMQQQLAARDAKIAELENQLRQPAPGAPQDSLLAGIEVTRDDLAAPLP